MAPTGILQSLCATFSVLIDVAKGAFDGLLTLAGVAIYHCGLAHAVINASRQRPRVVMYHACEPLEDDFIRGLSINTTPACFAAHLEFFTKYYQIVPLASLGESQSRDRALVITFDDGFRSVYDSAFPLLKQGSLAATCYLVTDCIGGEALIWILELNWYLQRHRKTAKAVVARRIGQSSFTSMRRLIQAVISRYDVQIVAGLLADLRVRLGPVPGLRAHQERLFLNHGELDEMSRHGITFGNHSASHAVLTNLGPSECRKEIRRAKEVLSALSGSVDSFAYPFGIRDHAARQIVIEEGYSTLMEVEGDNRPFDRSRVGRLNVTSVSPAVLFARLEVTAPCKFRLKRLIKRIFSARSRSAF